MVQRFCRGSDLDVLWQFGSASKLQSCQVFFCIDNDLLNIIS